MSATAWTCPIYHVNLIAIVCHEAELAAVLKRAIPANLPADFIRDILETAPKARGLCTDLERGKGDARPTLVFWVERLTGPRFVEYAAHETLHATERVLGRVGLTLNGDTAEAFTYYQGHLLRKVLALRATK